MRHGHPGRSVTIRFYSAQYLTLKADSAKVEDGVLILYVYTNDRSKLQPTRIFPIEGVEAAQLSDGTVVLGDPMLIRPQRIKMTTRIWLEIIVGLLLVFTIAWVVGQRTGMMGPLIQLRPQGSGAMPAKNR
jgi:hypothetical protein